MANRDRVKLAFIHVPDEGSGAVGGRQVQGLGRVRGWMTPAQAGWHWHWQIVCRWVCLAGRQTGTGLAGLEAALARGMAGQQRRRQASSSSSAAAARAARTILTTEPKRRSLKIWVGMQAEVERTCVVGGWATACSTKTHLAASVTANPRGLVWVQSREITDVCTRVPYLGAIS